MSLGSASYYKVAYCDIILLNQVGMRWQQL